MFKAQRTITLLDNFTISKIFDHCGYNGRTLIQRIKDEEKVDEFLDYMETFNFKSIQEYTDFIEEKYEEISLEIVGYGSYF